MGRSCTDTHTHTPPLGAKALIGPSKNYSCVWILLAWANWWRLCSSVRELVQLPTCISFCLWGPCGLVVFGWSVAWRKVEKFGAFWWRSLGMLTGGKFFFAICTDYSCMTHDEGQPVKKGSLDKTWHLSLLIQLPKDKIGHVASGLDGRRTVTAATSMLCRRRWVNLRLVHKSRPLGQPWHSVPWWSLPCCGLWHPSQTHPSQEHRVPLPGGGGGPRVEHLPLCFYPCG